MSEDLRRMVFHYGPISMVVVADPPTTGVWVVHSSEQLGLLEHQYGAFHDFGRAKLPITSPQAMETCGPMGMSLMRGLLTLRAARAAVPQLPPRPYFRLPIVWTEDTDRSDNHNIALVVSYTAELTFVAVVHSVEQLRALAKRFYPSHVDRVVSAVQATARLEARHDQPAVVLTEPKLTRDIIQGCVMSSDLPLPRGV